MKKLSLILSIIVVAAMLLTACATPAPTEAPAEEITLVVWDQFYRDVESQVIETLNAEFEAANPGVKIERVVKTLDDLKVTLKLALAEENGPDVAQVNQGRSDMGAMVEAGLLLPLNDYAAAYNWSERFSASVASRNSFTEDGKTLAPATCMALVPPLKSWACTTIKPSLMQMAGQFQRLSPNSKRCSGRSKLPV